MRRFKRASSAQRNFRQRQRQNKRLRTSRGRTKQQQRSVRQQKRQAARIARQKRRQENRTKRVLARQQSRADRVRAKAQGGAYVGKQQAMADLGTAAISEAAKIGGAIVTGGGSSLLEGLGGLGENIGDSGVLGQNGFGDGMFSGALDTFGEAFGGGGGAGGGFGQETPFGAENFQDFDLVEEEEKPPIYTQPLFLVAAGTAIYFLFLRPKK